MRKMLLLIIAVMCFCVPTFMSSLEAGTSGSALATVWIYRWDKAKDMTARIHVDKECIALLGLQQMTRIELPEGKYSFNSLASYSPSLGNDFASNSIDLDAKAGKTYYIKVQFGQRDLSVTSHRIFLYDSLSPKWRHTINTKCKMVSNNKTETWVDLDMRAKKFLPVEDKAVIYVYSASVRTSDVAAVSFNDKNAGTLQPKNYVRLEVPPGRHQLDYRKESSCGLSLDVEAGKIYYIKSSPVNKRGGNSDCTLAFISEDIARNELAHYTMIQPPGWQL